MVCVLVVEDEPIVGMDIRETLERMGYSVPAVVDSGDDVLRAVLANKPDLVLMDIKLRSFIDGVDAATRIKLVCDVPVIYLTAYPSKGSQDRALKTAPAGYLVKPVTDAALRECIERALSKNGDAVPSAG